MFGRLVATASGIGAVIAVEQILRKSPMLYDLMMGGLLSPHRVVLIWICLLPLIFYHAGPEIVSIAVAWRYHHWTENNEIVVLRSAGQSCTRIASPGMLTAVVGCLFCAVNSIVPDAAELEQDRRHPYCRDGAHQHRRVATRPRATASPGIALMFSRRGGDGETLEDVLISITAPTSRPGMRAWCGAAATISCSSPAGPICSHDETGLKQVAFNTLSLPLHMAPTGDEPARSRGYYEQSIDVYCIRRRKSAKRQPTGRLG